MLPSDHADDEQENPFAPFSNRAEFEFSEFIYAREQMSGGNIDELLRILAGLYPENDPPASKHDELYAMIDAIKDGDVAWDSFTIKYNGE